MEKKLTIKQLQELSLRGEKLTAITAYDYTMARIFDEAGIEIVLVGDSLGMVVQGQGSTLPVDFEHMVYHTRCVSRGVKRAHVMADMSFLSYQVSHEEAVKNAGLLMKAGAESVKIEGGEEFGDLIWYLNEIGIPVVAHIGLRPQRVHTMGGYKIQGKSKGEAEELMNDALILEEAGASFLVLEGIPMEVAKDITDSVKIPTIGISSGPFCSGQVLVSYDLLGANPDFKPRFVRQYMNLYESAHSAVSRYIQDVKNRKFPAETESFHRNLVEVKPVKK